MIVGLGCLAHDHVAVTDTPWAAGKGHIVHSEDRFGGNAPNALATIAALGYPAAYLATVGTSETGDAGVADLAARGVSTDFIQRVAGADPVEAHLTITADGERVIERNRIGELVDLFNETRVASFATAAGADESGLDQPRLRLRFLAWLSENTPEEAAGGHVLAGADFGSIAADGNVYARVEGSDEKVTVPPELDARVRELAGAPPPPPENRAPPGPPGHQRDGTGQRIRPNPGSHPES